jgi:choline dehydrogenase-like flavoprotein
MDEQSVLSERERDVLAVVCDALHPALAAGPGEDAALFAASASDLGVPAAAAEALALLAPAQQKELKQFLRVIDSALLGLFVCRTAKGVRAMSAEQRVALLLALTRSPIPQLRSGFQALKRLSCFLYYSAADAEGGNRVWRGIGYQPSQLPAAVERSVNVTRITESTTIDADVCVVGSGAGGGVVAAELASRGLRVVVLEAGPGDQAPDFEQREREGTQRLYLDSGLTSSRDLGVAILAGACLGGGTAVNWQTSLRTPDFIRDEWTDSSGCDLFTSPRFSRALDVVTSRSGCSTSESIVNANNEVVRRGCKTLGYEWSPIARNSHGCDDSQCGHCSFGCRLGAKQSTVQTFLRDAQQHGDTTIIAECSARRVLIAAGRAAGVEAIVRTNDGRELDVTVRAPRVVVAAGGIHSPALLLRSGITLSHLGRHLYLHPTTGAAGFYPDVIAPWHGPPQTILSSQFARVDGNFGFRLESAPPHPGLLSLSLPWTGAARYRQVMQQSANASVIIALTRDSTGGRVRVRRDGTASLDYLPGPEERALLARGSAAAVRVHFAAGAEEIMTTHASGLSFRRSPTTTQRDLDQFCTRVAAEPTHGNRSLIFSAHQMGTCRMGSDAEAAVCDERGQVFGVRGLYVADASVFPASSGVNPMITVMALAKCVGQMIE